MKAREILSTTFFESMIRGKVASALTELESNLRQALRQEQIKVTKETKQQVKKVLDEFFS